MSESMPPSAGLQPNVLLASAARFLIDGGEDNAANVLLACELAIWESGDTWYVGDEVHAALHVELAGPRVAYDALNDERSALGDAIRRSLRAVLPSDTYIKHFTVRGQLLEIDPEWRSELLELRRGRGVDNQPAPIRAACLEDPPLPLQERSAHRGGTRSYGRTVPAELGTARVDE